MKNLYSNVVPEYKPLTVLHPCYTGDCVYRSVFRAFLEKFRISLVSVLQNVARHQWSHPIEKGRKD